MEGTVKWFSREKGYGFIASDDGQDHYTNVSLIKGVELPGIGDRVRFDSREGGKGLRALNVEILQKQPSEKPQDDRVNCPECHKKIVPRMITYHGKPQKSVCPYCAATVKVFASNCFIATAVYNDPICAEVMTLRRFRDEKLRHHPLGRKFIAFYYKKSPPIARWLKDQPRLSAVIRTVLNVVVAKLGKH